MSLQMQFNNKILPKWNALFACQNKTRWCGFPNDIEDGSEALPSRRDNQFLICTAKNRVYFSGGLYVSKFWIIHVSARDTIDRAAALQGRTRTDSLIEAALEKAERVIVEQILIRLTLRPRAIDQGADWRKCIRSNRFLKSLTAGMVSGGLSHEAAFWGFILIWLSGITAKPPTNGAVLLRESY